MSVHIHIDKEDKQNCNINKNEVLELFATDMESTIKTSPIDIDNVNLDNFHCCIFIVT